MRYENQTLCVDLHMQGENICGSVDHGEDNEKKSMVFMEEARRDTGRETGAGTAAPLKDYLVAIKS